MQNQPSNDLQPLENNDGAELLLPPHHTEPLAFFRKTFLLHRLTKKKLENATPIPAVNELLVKKGITYWEHLACVGFNPQLSQLEAVVTIRRASGYNGELCTTGSKEYVRFFVDWHDGAGFQDAGLTSFIAHDISNAPPGPQHPLEYLVYLPLNAEKHKKICEKAVLPRVRAVLSWNSIPSLNPNMLPIFGNRRDADIQIAPAALHLGHLINEGIINAKSAALDQINPAALLPMLPAKATAWSTLLKDYREAKVPDHRLVFESVYPMIKPSISEGFATKADLSALSELNLNIDAIVDALSVKDADTTFEELTCVGLNPDSDILGAVIHVKKPQGYSGDLCRTGSREFVAFWADWNNNGTYDQYLGTSSVVVHDINGALPANGLYYSVMLPAQVGEHLKGCENPSIVRIRAVLSWGVAPSITDPNDLNFWGNRMDVLVQLRPAKKGGTLYDLIYDVGNVNPNDISPSTFLASPSLGVLDPTDCSQAAHDRPFGGMVRIGGRIYNTGLPGNVHYQVQFSPHGLNAWLPVTTSHTFELMHPNPFDPLYPQENVFKSAPDGWLPYQEDFTASPPILERTASLANWSTGALSGAYDLRLAYTTDFPVNGGSLIHYSVVVTIVLDNDDFSVSPTANPVVDAAFDLDLVIDGGDCHSYPKSPATIINGHLRARDKHFWKWSLGIQPTTHSHGTLPTPSCRSYGSLVDEGDANLAWTLNTGLMDKCGYTLSLYAYDRTIVDSNGAVVHGQMKAVGFSVV
jgi:hypothetical protein